MKLKTQIIIGTVITAYFVSRIIVSIAFNI